MRDARKKPWNGTSQEGQASTPIFRTNTDSKTTAKINDSREEEPPTGRTQDPWNWEQPNEGLKTSNAITATRRATEPTSAGRSRRTSRKDATSQKTPSDFQKVGNT
jgi:hypothetical protein